MAEWQRVAFERDCKIIREHCIGVAHPVNFAAAFWLLADSATSSTASTTSSPCNCVIRLHSSNDAFKALEDFRGFLLRITARSEKFL